MAPHLWQEAGGGEDMVSKGLLELVIIVAGTFSHGDKTRGVAKRRDGQGQGMEAV